MALPRLNSIYTRHKNYYKKNISASSQTCTEISYPLYLLVSFMSVTMQYLSQLSILERIAFVTVQFSSSNMYLRPKI